VAQRVGRGIALLFYDHGTRRGDEWSAARPGRTLPPGKTRYPLYRRMTNMIHDVRYNTINFRIYLNGRHSDYNVIAEGFY
jgi:hypothetical protein